MKKNAIVITGANGNVGSYFVKKYLKKQNRVILIIHKKDDKITDIIKNKNIAMIRADLANLEALSEKFAESILQTNWQPDRLIHTATIRSHDFKPLSETDPKLWSKIVNVNIIGTFNILKTMIPYYRKINYGKIVLFASNVTRIGLPKGSAYSASKSAIANISRTVAAEEAKNKIIINTVSPGPIKIDNSQFSESYRQFREEYYKETLKDIPLKRCASVEDLFGLCNFLISPENSYITGEQFFITGGKV